MPDSEAIPLGARVTILRGPEEGEVIARTVHINQEDSYLVRYHDATGRAVERVWGESALTEAAES